MKAVAVVVPVLRVEAVAVVVALGTRPSGIVWYGMACIG